MKNRDLYVSALHLIGENAYAEENLDYEERAPYLIAAFCSEAANTEAAYREYKELDKAPVLDNVNIPLDTEFPFIDRFCHAATLYLAAMLIIDENPELSDKLYDKYCDIISRIVDSTRATVEKISDVYCFD